MIRGVEREGQRIRLLGDDDTADGALMDWREAERVAITLLNHVRAARDRELGAAGLPPAEVEHA